MNKTCSRIVALIIILYFTVSIPAFAAMPADVAGLNIDAEVGLLSALKIMMGDENGMFKPDSDVTRAEFTSVVIRMLNVEAKTGENQTVQFRDVPNNHWALKNIIFANNVGLIAGNGDGTFQPDAKVTYEQAVKVLVCAVGYEEQAKEKGSYSEGYLAVATEKGFLKDFSGQMGQALKRKNIAFLMNNVLNADIKLLNTYGGQLKYEQKEGQTFLENVYGISRQTGQVTAVSNAALSGESNLKENELQIENIVLKTDNKSYANLLGYNVDCYFRDNAGEKTVIFISPVKNSNRVLNLSAENIANTSTIKEISYTLGQNGSSDKGTAPLSPTATLVYNGSGAALSDQLLKPSSGTITLVDKNNDNIYDVIFVNSYETIVINSIDLSSGKITDKNDSAKAIVLGQNNLTFSMKDVNGNDVELNQLKEGNVLSVAESLNHKTFSIIVSNMKISGEIESKNADSVTVSGNAYKLEKFFLAKNTNLAVGDTGVFYLDSQNRIAGFSKD